MSKPLFTAGVWAFCGNGDIILRLDYPTRSPVKIFFFFLFFANKLGGFGVIGEKNKKKKNKSENFLFHVLLLQQCSHSILYCFFFLYLSLLFLLLFHVLLSFCSFSLLLFFFSSLISLFLSPSLISLVFSLFLLFLIFSYFSYFSYSLSFSLSLFLLLVIISVLEDKASARNNY